MNYIHVGIQRSGTNFLSKLISLNFNISFINNMGSNENGKDIDRNNPLHKHFRIQDDKSTIVMDDKYKNDLIFETFNDYKKYLGFSELKVIIIQKDIQDWLKSIKKWALMCKWVKDEKEFDDVKGSYINEYNQFYNKWYSFHQQNPNDIVVLNLNKVINDFDNEYPKLGSIFELKNDVIYPTEVSLSGKRKMNVDSKKYKIRYE